MFIAELNFEESAILTTNIRKIINATEPRI